MNATTANIDRLARLNDLSGADPAAHDALATALLRNGQFRELARLSGPPTKPASQLAKKIRAQKLRPGCHVAIGKRALESAKTAGFVLEDNTLSRLGYVCHVDEQTRIEQARREWDNRQNRISHPIGHFDKGRRWYPDEVENCPHSVRSPSRAHPFSYLVHCRTALHVAWLYSVNRKAMMKR